MKDMVILFALVYFSDDTKCIQETTIKALSYFLVIPLLFLAPGLY